MSITDSSQSLWYSSCNMKRPKFMPGLYNFFLWSPKFVHALLNTKSSLLCLAKHNHKTRVAHSDINYDHHVFCGCPMKREELLDWKAVQYQVIFYQLFMDHWLPLFFSYFDYEYLQTKMFYLKICTISWCITWYNFCGQNQTRVGIRLKFQNVISPWNKNKLFYYTQ